MVRVHCTAQPQSRVVTGYGWHVCSEAGAKLAG
jgi:hypothetical protein